MDESSTSQPGLWQRRLEQLKAKTRGAIPFVAGVLSALVALFLYTWFVPAPTPLSMDQVNESVVQAMASATPAPAYSSLVYQAILPSLVFIEVHSPEAVEVTSDGRRLDEDEEGESNDATPPDGPVEPFPDEGGTNEEDGNVPDAEEISGLGSGVVINTDGAVLTSLHVVTNSSEIHLTFADGTTSDAQIIAVQPDHDIAVLLPDKLPGVLVPAVLGNPDAMRVGDEAYAVGHPFGLYGSMSSGVISGFERTFRIQNSDQRIEGLIQIDAAVNPGNSGGPLLNRYGQVVGIVTGLANPSDETFFVGIGFAVPIDIAAGGAGLPPY